MFKQTVFDDPAASFQFPACNDEEVSKAIRWYSFGISKLETRLSKFGWWTALYNVLTSKPIAQRCGHS